MLNEYEKCIRRRRIPRLALLHPLESAIYKIFESRSNQALVTLTGLDFDSFTSLNCLFTPIFDNYSPFIDKENGYVMGKQSTRGRKRVVNSTIALALNLAWTRTRGSVMVLQIMFGLTETNVSAYLRFGRRILIKF